MPSRRYHRSQRLARERFKQPDTVHITNLPHNVTQCELTAALRPFGAVASSLIQKSDRRSITRPYTFAFVNFVEQESSERCIQSQLPLDIRGYVLKFNRRTGNECDRTRQPKHEEPTNVPEYQDTQVPIEKPAAQPQEQVPYGLTLLVDRIPSQWTSAQLYNALAQTVSGISSVLVYQDEDQYHLRQGLVQLSTLQQAERLAAQGWIKAGDRVLGCRRSEVKSIGLLRRCYNGNVSIHNHVVENEAFMVDSEGDTDFQSISNLPTGPMGRAGSPAMPPWIPTIARNFGAGEVAPDFGCDFGRDFRDFGSFMPNPYVRPPRPRVLADRPIDPYPTVAFTPFSPQDEPSSSTTTPATEGGTPFDDKPVFLTNNFASFIGYHPAMPLVASSTLIVEGLKPSNMENLQGDIGKLSGFSAASIDLVRNDKSLKAFICYNNPSEACASLSSIQRHYQGTAVMVRFA